MSRAVGGRGETLALSLALGLVAGSDVPSDLGLEVRCTQQKGSLQGASNPVG